MNARTCICGEDASKHQTKPALGCKGFDPDWQLLRERYFDVAPRQHYGHHLNARHVLNRIAAGDATEALSAEEAAAILHELGAAEAADAWAAYRQARDAARTTLWPHEASVVAPDNRSTVNERPAQHQIPERTQSGAQEQRVEHPAVKAARGGRPRQKPI